MGTIAFVRHGQASLFAADYDELSERGRAQANALGDHLGAAGVLPDRVWTGPAKRQRDTAAIVIEAARRHGSAWPEPELLPELDEHDAFGMVTKVMPRLQEDAEMLPRQRALAEAKGIEARSAAFQSLFEAIMARWLRGELEAEEIESWPAFRQRVEAGIAKLVAAAPGRGGRIFAFSSVGPLAVLLRRATQSPDLAAFQTAWRCRNASVSRFVFSGSDRFTLDAFNDLSHLPDPDTHTFR